MHVSWRLFSKVVLSLDRNTVYSVNRSQRGDPRRGVVEVGWSLIFLVFFQAMLGLGEGVCKACGLYGVFQQGWGCQ